MHRPSNKTRRKLLVCQNETCRQQGSKKVLAAFQAETPPEIEVESTGCLGQCGSGPMVLLLPEEIWYCHIHPDEVSEIVEKHLKQGRVVREKLYPKFHPPRPIGIWLVAFFMLLGTIIMFYWTIATQIGSGAISAISDRYPV